MSNMADKCVDLRLSGLDRRPMLTAMMVYLAGVGVAALIVAFTVWRDASCSPNPQKFHAQYLAAAFRDPNAGVGVQAKTSSRLPSIRFEVLMTAAPASNSRSDWLASSSGLMRF